MLVTRNGDAAVNGKGRLLPTVTGLRDAIAAKAEEWKVVTQRRSTRSRPMEIVPLASETG
jgi:hypothetical protein